jgi:hypothetical protein
MKDERWYNEVDQAKLMVKLQEEVGEMSAALIRGKKRDFLNECNDVSIILDQLIEVVRAHGINVGWSHA